MEIYKLVNSFLKNYPSIDIFVLDTLLRIDPTVVQNNHGLFAGRYGVWIGNMCANGNIKLGDIPELKSALVTYDKNKTQLPQIKDCKSLSELIEWVKDLSDDFKAVRKQSKSKADLEKVYEDSEWVVYVPHSHAAARRGGEGTHWCTASENDHYYNYYSKDGPFYINVRKSDGAKFQFHFETDQFMDADDKPAKLRDIELSEGSINFYSKIDTVFKFRLKFDAVGELREGFARAVMNGKCNFINKKGQILSKLWFNSTFPFSRGFARVEMNGKYNFINTDGQILSQQWFDDIGIFNEGLAGVGLNDKYNFIDTKGELLSNQWFDNVGCFYEGFARVKLNGKWNSINKECQFLSQQWFDRVDNFDAGLVRVELNDKWNYVNTEGQLLSKQWFDDVAYFSNGLCQVKLNGQYNFINKEGLLSNQWFDGIGSFNEGFARVGLSDMWNFMNTKGQFLSAQWFDDARNFHRGFAEVELKNEWKLINSEGQLLPKQ